MMMMYELEMQWTHSGDISTPLRFTKLRYSSFKHTPSYYVWQVCVRVCVCVLSN